NRRFHEAKPWASEEPERRRTIAEGLWLLKSAAIWLAPYIPFSSDSLFRMLGYPEGPKAGDWEGVLTPVPAGQPLGDVRPLFPKPERKPAPAAPAKAAPSRPTGELPPLEIRAARITEVENHPSADRLYVLTVDAGEPRPRTVVAGLRDAYTPEQLRGRLVALLANLEPRTIRRITSQGMVLAAEIDGKAALVEVPQDVEPGRPISGVATPAPSVAYSQFEQTPILVGQVEREAGQLSDIAVGDRTVRAPGAWPAGTAILVRLAGDGATEGTVLAFDDRHPLATPTGVRPGTRVK
ncbi:MAG: hypothetical protein L3J77_03275, partial [Thermoplasmata archaeon]|nr:hypothetical protein [Thermoplasmata archaeon]